MTNVTSERPTATAGVALVGTILLLFIGWDLVADYRSGSARLHLLAESFILLLAAAGTALLWRRFTAVRAAHALLERDLEAARADALRWRRESRAVLDGLGSAIERQFDRWSLSPAESEVGLLLLKGLSHKEVAQVRRTSERTVRQQARSLYSKAGLSGRSELSGFFLEDLLLPHRRDDSTPGPPPSP